MGGGLAAPLIYGCFSGDTSCPSGLTVCSDDICADLQSDPKHCGQCNKDCGRGYSCKPTGCACDLDFYKVCPDPSQPQGSVCTDTNSDVNNCGGCGIKCKEGQTCFVNCR
jgi:hypothetical protein